MNKSVLDCSNTISNTKKILMIRKANVISFLSSLRSFAMFALSSFVWVNGSKYFAISSSQNITSLSLSFLSLPTPSASVLNSFLISSIQYDFLFSLFSSEEFGSWKLTLVFGLSGTFSRVFILKFSCSSGLIGISNQKLFIAVLSFHNSLEC